jgi:hypothetical protein
MKSINKFRIVKVVLKNELGEKISKNFRIEIYKRFLFVPYWEPVSKSKLFGQNFVEIPLYFETFKQAKKNVKKLCKKNNTELNKVKITEMETFECSKK